LFNKLKNLIVKKIISVKGFFIISGLVVLTATAVGLAHFSQKTQTKSPAAKNFANTKKKFKDIPLHKVERGELEIFITAKGAIEAVKSVRIKAPNIRRFWRYRLTKMATEGKIVDKGTIVAEFDTDEIDKLIKELKLKIEELEDKETEMVEGNKNNLQDYLDRIDKAKREITDAKASNELKVKELKEKITDAKFTYNEKKRQQDIELKQLQDKVVAAQRALKLKELANLNLKYAAEIEKQKMKLQLQEAQENVKKAKQAINIAKSNHAIELKKYRSYIERAKSDLTNHEIYWKSKLDALQKDLKKQKRHYESRKRYLSGKLKRHRNYMKKKKLELASYQKEKSQFVIRAPVRGLVLYRTFWHDGAHAAADVGDTIKRNYYFMSLPFLDKMKSVVRINEIDKIKLKNGLDVKIDLPSYDNLSFKGYIKNIANVANKERDEKVKTFKVEIFFYKSDKRLRPGLTTVNKITIAKYPNVLKVPIAAVFFNKKQKYCYVQKNEKFQRINLVTGPHNMDFIIVKEGLNQGDIVALVRPNAEDVIL
jgi:multidrug efflux pump subunit AcrA (membrane-fusion protein)